MAGKHILGWDHFLEVSEHLKSAEKIYRGQADASWRLRPSLTRVLKDHNVDRERAIGIERALLEAFQESNTDAFIASLKPDDKILWWTVMQHYGAPTRLLDWSTDINVALYFAVCDRSDCDGSLFCFDDGHLNFIRRIRRNAEWVDFDSQLEKSVSGQEYEASIYAFTNELPIERKSNQHSCFTISTELTEDVEGIHDEMADRLVLDGVHGSEGLSLVAKYIIDKSLKATLLRELMNLGITGQYLFPGLDGLGKMTKDLLSTMVPEPE